jgi:nitrogen fixation NifU-like protein
MDIYREKILEEYRHPKNFGRLQKPDASFEANNSVCGDKIGVEIKKGKAENGERKIEDIKFWGEGCAIAISAASMLTEKVKGMGVEEVKRLGYEDIKKMLGIKLSPVRAKCALLPLEVLQKVVSLL